MKSILTILRFQKAAPISGKGAAATPSKKPTSTATAATRRNVLPTATLIRVVRQVDRRARLKPTLTFYSRPQAIILLVAILMFRWRVSLNKGDDAKMDEKTNPANHIDNFLIRALTKNYYVFLHYWLLICPMQLACDWSSFGIPSITGVGDNRNLQTLGLYAITVKELGNGWAEHLCVTRFSIVSVCHSAGARSHEAGASRASRGLLDGHCHCNYYVHSGEWSAC